MNGAGVSQHPRAGAELSHDPGVVSCWDQTGKTFPPKGMKICSIP